MLALKTWGAKMNTHSRSHKKVPRIVLATKITTLYLKGPYKHCSRSRFIVSYCNEGQNNSQSNKA